MASRMKRYADSCSDGEPPKKIQKRTESIKFTIYDFQDREEKREEFIESSVLKAHGYEWRIWVHPRGERKSPTDTEYVSCFLKFRGRRGMRGLPVTAKLSLRCKQHASEGATRKFNPGCKGWGCPDFLKREDVLARYLEADGSFVMEADIQIAEEDRRVWYPKQLQQQEILMELYQDASSETADVVFSIGTMFYRVHKAILSTRCKKLYEIAMEDIDDDSPIPIPSVSGNVFKQILDFVYTVKTPEIENEDSATSLLVAADEYECIQLKLYVESVIVDKLLSAANAAAFFILADSHSCALLKEAATKVINSEKEIAMASKAWEQINESTKFLKELYVALASSNTPVTDEVEGLDVAALRMELQEAKLDLDGSRKVLVDRLKTYRSNQVTDN